MTNLFATLVLLQSVASYQTAPVMVESFVERLERQIDEEMFHPRLRRGESGEGIVHIAFKLGATGLPYDVCIARRASPSLDRAAVDTINKIGPLAGGDTGKQYVAVLQYAVASSNDPRDFAKELEHSVAAARRSKTLPRSC